MILYLGDQVTHPRETALEALILILAKLDR